ncbi:hypothetical protein Kisp02_42820 [Kineosporia sp. NBRC 101731]|nr:hypothetical protein Kisp02_42820 [Kineosporia sp. NBRC 101731]
MGFDQRLYPVAIEPGHAGEIDNDLFRSVFAGETEQMQAHDRYTGGAKVTGEAHSDRPVPEDQRLYDPIDGGQNRPAG